MALRYFWLDHQPCQLKKVVYDWTKEDIAIQHKSPQKLLFIGHFPLADTQLWFLLLLQKTKFIVQTVIQCTSLVNELRQLSLRPVWTSICLVKRESSCEDTQAVYAPSGPKGCCLFEFQQHRATRSISSPPQMGCQSITGLPNYGRFAYESFRLLYYDNH